MALNFPFTTDKSTAYLGDVISAKLSLAVRLIDDYTKQQPLGRINVELKGNPIKAIMNLSGYSLFNDMAAGTYELVIDSELYFLHEETVDIPRPDPKNPVLEIILSPKPSYPFPSGSTLIRAVVSNSEPVVNAEVKVAGKPIETITDANGEFVLFFRGIKQENISIEIKKYGITVAVPATVEEGKTISLGVIPF